MKANSFILTSEKARQALIPIISSVKASAKFTKLWNKLKEVESDKEKANQAFKQGDIDEALRMYTKLLEADADNSIFLSSIYANRSLCYLQKKMYEEAIGDLTKAIKLNENYVKAYLRRGSTYYAIKQYEKAKKDFEAVLQIDSSYSLTRLP